MNKKVHAQGLTKDQCHQHQQAQVVLKNPPPKEGDRGVLLELNGKDDHHKGKAESNSGGVGMSREVGKFAVLVH